MEAKLSSTPETFLYLPIFLNEKMYERLNRHQRHRSTDTQPLVQESISRSTKLTELAGHKTIHTCAVLIKNKTDLDNSMRCLKGLEERLNVRLFGKLVLDYQELSVWYKLISKLI